MKDYFDLLELPLSFRPDPELLKKHYYRLSRSYHPDHYTMADDKVREEVLLISGDINTAYKVLSDEQKRLSYLLHFLNVLKDGEHEVMSQEFLMEIMDINEAIFDLEIDYNEDRKSEIINEIGIKMKEFNNNLDKAIDLFENQADRESALKNIKENYLKIRYILRIQENISKFATL
ncbi:MAG TPA: iron-sulfur cluster co-chaperone HscB C-terminal domain-containing protein [Saprospiraceae bacterium]|nr:DnaJ domain-containing protein [Saprospiraceae bacterium]HRO09628.1 iron-sulfur cluster co-chaperone HscB C-terminal domain-containing protein [Saprospiraceae bacterium]HRP42901.1 iron-sulfur cluster co-chaperone HscB C-terminal domain-containing protein [Saprospiraceae bacterium]